MARTFVSPARGGDPGGTTAPSERLDQTGNPSIQPCLNIHHRIVGTGTSPRRRAQRHTHHPAVLEALPLWLAGPTEQCRWAAGTRDRRPILVHLASGIKSATSTCPWHRSQLRVKDAYYPATRVRTGSAPKTSEPRLDCDGITLWLLRRVPALGSFDVRALVRVAGLGPVLAPLTHFQQASRGRVVCGCWDATIDRACFTNAWPYLYTDGSFGRKHGYRYGVLAFIVSRLPETQLWVAATRRSINRRCNILSRALNVIRGRFRL